jgi:D-alanyl-D-alanine carboxypeptidase/D-alanyl-D-alanine-endopeptidase (penicillin-binding protein 4)
VQFVLDVMRILKRIHVVQLLLLLPCWFAANSVSAHQLPAKVLEALKEAEIPKSAVGVWVQEVSRKKALISWNQDMPFSPASTMKLVTTNAALDVLGPTFTWKTQAFADGTLNGDVLNGDLIIKGSGDPKLVTENFWLFLRQIRAKGIREIRGDVLLDRSAFEDGAYDPAAFDGDAIKTYNAGTDALLLNYDAFRFQFIPNSTASAVNVIMDPPVASYPITAPILSNDACGDWQRKLQASLDGHGVVFKGTFSLACGEKTWYVYPYQMTHTQYFGTVFRRMWSDLGGVFKGDVRDGVTTSTAHLITEWQSTTLPEVIRDINKYSNNVMARQLLLTMSAQATKAQANTQDGAKVIKDWLSSKDIEAPELVIENGSGLSRNERIAPHTMARILVDAFKSPLMPEFISSMPLVGYDGTMRNRLNGQDVAGNAHIKSGSLADVRAVAGYILAESGKRYVVVCFINHENASQGVDALDALMQWVYEHG